MFAFKKICLASNSPRRKALLEQIRIPFDCLEIPEHLDVEKHLRRLDTESSHEYVLRLALAKNQTARGYLNTNTPILTADTVVILNDQIFGKPASRDQAKQMLAALSGKTHHVVTAIALSAAHYEPFNRVVETKVRFSHLTDADIERYLTLEDAMDKAGAYGIQGLAALFIKEIQGSYSNVVGLPLFETGQLLTHLGLNCHTDT